MDYFLLISRLGNQLREKRINRGLTQAQLADLAGLTRYKVIAVEKGTLSVGMIAYARVLVLWIVSLLSFQLLCRPLKSLGIYSNEDDLSQSQHA